MNFGLRLTSGTGCCEEEECVLCKMGWVIKVCSAVAFNSSFLHWNLDLFFPSENSPNLSRLLWPFFVASFCTFTVSVSYIPPWQVQEYFQSGFSCRLEYYLTARDTQHPTPGRGANSLCQFLPPPAPLSAWPGDTLWASTLLWMKRPFKIH